ncbi:MULTISPECIES: hypothetical protein [unclassified Amycolatopsis]|uniref:hypothetical protein n=1 Tax=unclassified Amycolatopsis TaxID=2618356 RepID=UPI002E0E6A84|nr:MULTISPECIES: hypothetical protein [unclassified Amycolatopsis]WSK75185.1 hypothetical protein OG570_27785 [Amycolatopsis sp. NBC_01286]
MGVWRILWPVLALLPVTPVPPTPPCGPSLTWQPVAVRRIGAPCRPTPQGCIRRIEVTTVVFVVSGFGHPVPPAGPGASPVTRATMAVRDQRSEGDS